MKMSLDEKLREKQKRKTKLLVIYAEDLNEPEFQEFAGKLAIAAEDTPYSFIITSKPLHFIAKEELLNALKEICASA